MTINDIVVRKIFDEQTVAASSTADSEVFDLGSFTYNRSYALQIYVTGTGASVTATYMQSNDKTNFIVPSGGSAICTDYPDTTDADYAIYSFTPVVARFMKIRLTETAAAEATVTAWLSMG